MSDLLGKIAMGWLRHIVAGIGVWLLHSGYITSDQQSELVGALMTLLPIALSALSKWEAEQAHNKQLLEAAKLASPNSGSTQKGN